jgi:hypothetical protein
MTWKLFPASEFENHRDHWQRLNQEAGGPPLLDVAFISPLLQMFGTGKEILACYESDNRLQAMTILAQTGPGTWVTFQPSQAPLGAWIHGSAYINWNQLLSELIRKLPGFPLILGVTQQDPDLLPRPRDDRTLKTLDYVQTARIRIHGKFEDYWNARGKNLRQNMRTQRNNLQKCGVSTRLQVIIAVDDVAQAIVDYGRLESASWKAKIGTAIHPENVQGKFYRAMLEAFCRRNAGRIYRYWYEDKIVAMDLCIEGNGCIIILKTTHDESIGNATSPALLMQQEVFRQLFDEGRLKTIEYYGKVMEWNSRWSDDLRILYHVNEYRWPSLLALRDIMSKPRALTCQGK